MLGWILRKIASRKRSGTIDEVRNDGHESPSKVDWGQRRFETLRWWTVVWTLVVVAYVLNLIGPSTGAAAADASREDVAYLFALLVPLSWILQNRYVKQGSAYHRSLWEQEEAREQKGRITGKFVGIMPKVAYVFYLVSTIIFLISSHKSPALVVPVAVLLLAPVVQYVLILREWLGRWSGEH